MQHAKILVTTIGLVLAFGLLWHSRSQADAIDHFQPAALHKAERALGNGDDLVCRERSVQRNLQVAERELRGE